MFGELPCYTISINTNLLKNDTRAQTSDAHLLF